MSGESSSMVCNIILMGLVQSKLENVIQVNMVAMNKAQLRCHIQGMNEGLEALVQLPTTIRLYILLTKYQSVHHAEARISVLLEEGKEMVTERDNLKQGLALIQHQLMEVEERTPDYDHREWDEKVQNLEEQLGARAPEQTHLARDQEDVQAQLVIMMQSANKYQEQVTQILRLTEGMTDCGAH
jgi:hypothetical protein